MRPTVAALLVMFLPLVAAAQEPTESTAAANDLPALRLPTIDFATAADLAPLAPRTFAQSPPQPRRAPQPRPADAGSRRRPSMVGYIENAGIHSQIRFRFDAGFCKTRPRTAPNSFTPSAGAFRPGPCRTPIPRPRTGWRYPDRAEFPAVPTRLARLPCGIASRSSRSCPFARSNPRGLSPTGHHGPIASAYPICVSAPRRRYLPTTPGDR